MLKRCQHPWSTGQAAEGSQRAKWRQLFLSSGSSKGLDCLTWWQKRVEQKQMLLTAVAQAEVQLTALGAEHPAAHFS